jgi:hypothetical protein
MGREFTCFNFKGAHNIDSFRNRSFDSKHRNSDEFYFVGSLNYTEVLK